MQIEMRPKHAGVKIHLDGDECKTILDYYTHNKTSAPTLTAVVSSNPLAFPYQHVTKLGKKIKALLAEEPLLLDDRTEEQVQAALLRDQEKITKQLKAMETGEDWKF